MTLTVNIVLSNIVLSDIIYLKLKKQQDLVCCFGFWFLFNLLMAWISLLLLSHVPHGRMPNDERRPSCRCYVTQKFEAHVYTSTWTMYHNSCQRPGSSVASETVSM